MEEYTQITLDQWMQWKEDIRQKLAETAGNFVYIGFRLKQIRDSGMYDGAADIFEFAQKEYGLGKSTVSRFIAINERYSEGGNSLELKEEYRNFSSSKLSEMLTLPDNELELITEKTTIREIRELKEFGRQEIPNGSEAQDPGNPETAEIPVRQQDLSHLTPLEKCLADFFQTRKEQLKQILSLLNTSEPDEKAAMELMNPSGQTSHKKGLCFLFLYDWTTGVKYKLLTSPEPVSMSWPEFLEVVVDLFENKYDINAENVDLNTDNPTNEKSPQIGENQAVATSQQNEEKQEENTEEDSEEYPEEDEDSPRTKRSTAAAGSGRKESNEDKEWKDPKPEPKPIELPPADATYREDMGKTLLTEITDGPRRYLIIKKRHPYREGNTVVLRECDKGSRTGKVVEIEITHMTDDSGGLTPGYCVIGFADFLTYIEDVTDEDED